MTDAELLAAIRDVVERWEHRSAYGNRGFYDDGAIMQIAWLLNDGEVPLGS